ncbi:MAG TPA: PLDc N-terminal domain-containing protein [Jiangellaceae bacterium]
MLRIVLFLALLVIWIWALVDVIITPNGTFRHGDKTIWLLVVLFAGTIGALVYVAVGRPRLGENRY